MFGDTRQMIKPDFLERERESIVHLERSCGGNLIFSDVAFIKSIYRFIFSVAHTSKATRRFISQSQESIGFKIRINTFLVKQQTQLALVGPRLN